MLKVVDIEKSKSAGSGRKRDSARIEVYLITGGAVCVPEIEHCFCLISDVNFCIVWRECYFASHSEQSPARCAQTANMCRAVLLSWLHLLSGKFLFLATASVWG